MGKLLIFLYNLDYRVQTKTKKTKFMGIIKMQCSRKDLSDYRDSNFWVFIVLLLKCRYIKTKDNVSLQSKFYFIQIKFMIIINKTLIIDRDWPIKLFKYFILRFFFLKVTNVNFLKEDLITLKKSSIYNTVFILRLFLSCCCFY